MSIRRRWTATCDEPDCEACIPLLGDQEDGKWDLGLLIYESHDWQAAPGIDETYCPKHHRSDFFTEAKP